MSAVPIKALSKGEEVLASELEIPGPAGRQGLGLVASVGTRILTAEVVVVTEVIDQKCLAQCPAQDILAVVPGSIPGLAVTTLSSSSSL